MTPRWKVFVIAGLAMAVLAAAIYFPILRRRVRRAARLQQQSEVQARRELIQPVAVNPADPRVKTSLFWASDAGDSTLAPVTVELPLSSDPVLRSKQVLNTLLAGPVDVELRTLPPDAVLLAFYILADGTAIADFSEALATSIPSGIQSEQLAVDSMTHTLEANVPQVKRLKILIHGQEEERSDNRSADQMRPLKITPDFISTAEGSVLIELGNTRVICTATVDDGVPLFLKGSGKGWVTSEYGMLPRATEERTPREATRGKQSGRTVEIQRLIGRSLRAVTDQEALGERTVWLDCDVIQADGGTRTASITGAFVALAVACERLLAAGILKSSPLIDTVAATSVGIVDDRALLDLAYEEDSRAEVDMNVVMTGGGHFVEIQATAEGRAFSGSEMQDLLALAAAGIRRLTEEQRAVLPLKFSARAR